MTEERIRIPVSYTGIMRYFEEYRSKVVLKPEHALLMTFLLIGAILLLHLTNLFGF